MLLVVGTQSAIIRTSPLHGRVVSRRHLRRLDENFPASAIVFNIIRDQNFFVSMRRAMLQQKYVSIFKYDFPFKLAETRRAYRQRDVVKQIWPHSAAHACVPRFLKNFEINTATPITIAVGMTAVTPNSPTRAVPAGVS